MPVGIQAGRQRERELTIDIAYLRANISQLREVGQSLGLSDEMLDVSEFFVLNHDPITDDQWNEIQKYLDPVADPAVLQRIRFHIDVIVFIYRSESKLSIEEMKVDEWKPPLVKLISDLEEAAKSLRAVMTNQLGRIILSSFVVHYREIGLEVDDIDVLENKLAMMVFKLRKLIEMFPVKRGRKSAKTEILVKDLARIVKSEYDRPLSRYSEKSRDKEFIDAVFRVARPSVQLKTGHIDNAMRPHTRRRGAPRQKPLIE